MLKGGVSVRYTALLNAAILSRRNPDGFKGNVGSWQKELGDPFDF